MKEWIIKVGEDGRLINSQPEKEIIRCKDCKHQVDNGRRFKDCDMHFLQAKDDWFCADGERKEDK